MPEWEVKEADASAAFYPELWEEVIIMKLYKMFASLSQFFSEAIAYIFTPSGDRYPLVGVQPYEGDPCPEDLDAEA